MDNSPIRPDQPPPALKIPLARTAAPHATMHREAPHGEARGNPHEDEHVRADIGVDVEVRLRFGGIFEGVADDSADDGAGQGQNHGSEREDGEREGPPARLDGEDGRNKDEDEVEHAGGQEEAEHDLRGNAQDREDGDNGSGNRDSCTREKLVHNDLDRVEPVERFGVGAVGYSPVMCQHEESIEKERERSTYSL